MKQLSRRRFGYLLASVGVAGPRIAIAERSSVVHRIGVLTVNAPQPEAIQRQAASLSALGWVEGENLLVERRDSNGLLEGLTASAEALVRAKVEVIMADGPNPTLAAMRATTTIPIVFYASDPVGSGLVASLSRPGGNVTGFSATGYEADAKLLSLLKEMLPTIRRIGMLETPGNPQFALSRGPLGDACRSLGLEPIFVEVASATHIDGAIAPLKRQGVDVLLLRSDSFAMRHGPEVIRVAKRYGLPTVTENSDLVRKAEALACYHVTGTEVRRRVAYYVDRILRGAKPADLPVEQPTEFELTINLKTAGALGLRIPKETLLRATEVIR